MWKTFGNLLAGGADVNAKDPDGWTALISACREGHSKVVKELLEAGADVQVKDKNGWTPLMWAAASGHHNIVDLLVEKGAELEARDQYGASALMKASRRGFEDEVKLLLDKGADVNAKDDYWLECADEGLSHEATQKWPSYLLESWADTEAKDQYGATALDHRFVRRPLGCGEAALKCQSRCAREGQERLDCLNVGFLRRIQGRGGVLEIARG